MKSYSVSERAGLVAWAEQIGLEREKAKLEMLVRLTCALISRALQSHAVPGCAGLQGLLQEGLTEFAGTGVPVPTVACHGA